jgi:uncharacterized membrane protein HdeD (DUF308 family)
LAQSFDRGATVIVTNPLRATSWTREQIANVSRGWWIVLITGIISVVAGSIILFTDWTVGDLAVFVGAVLVFRGLFTTLSVPIDGAARGWSVALGLLEAGVGVAVWAWPGPTLLVLAAFIGWWVLFAGVMAIAGAISGRGVLPYWGLTLAFGIVETLFSFWLLARPGLTLVAAVLAIGLWTMVYGVVEIVLAFEVRRLPSQPEAVARQLDVMTSQDPLDAALR